MTIFKTWQHFAQSMLIHFKKDFQKVSVIIKYVHPPEMLQTIPQIKLKQNLSLNKHVIPSRLYCMHIKQRTLLGLTEIH